MGLPHIQGPSILMEFTARFSFTGQGIRLPASYGNFFPNRFDICKQRRRLILTGLSRLLADFSQLFESLTQLPPRRSHDFHIPLQPNTQPVSARPYRYPCYKKTEIEKMVKEL